MLRFICIVAIVTLFKSSSADEPPPPPPPPPPQCRGPPPGLDLKVNPHECCKKTQFYTKEDLMDCGFQKMDEPMTEKHGPPDCSKYECLMKKFNSLNEDKTIDEKHIVEVLAKWLESNPGFEAAVDKTKERCLGRELPGPPQVCPLARFMFCVEATLFSECAVWDDSENCQKVKKHINECKKYHPF